jgi:hypothetical protein
MRVRVALALSLVLALHALPLRADITAGGGGSSSGSTLPVLDTQTIVSGSSDPTKLIRFEVDGLTTGTTRVLTPQNANGTLAYIDGSQTWTGSNVITQTSGIVLAANAGMLVSETNATILFGTGSGGGRLAYYSFQTPFALVLSPGAAANSLLFVEDADAAFDFAVPQQTNPTIVVASANQSTSERLGIRHNQVQGQIVDLAPTAANARPIGTMGGSAVASATTITPTGNLFHVTGTATINTITIMASGTVITIVFDSTATVADGAGNVKLPASFVATPDDTLTLVSDGSSWYFVSSGVN